jgi:tetratricopeptide (TPR) repeat protein
MIRAAALTAVFAATAFDQTFDAGLQAYYERDYAASIRAFEQLVEQGVAAPEVFYNLGNAYYRASRLGPAIANYERALHLRPDMEDARENLELCVNETERRLSKPRPAAWEQALLFWHYRLDPDTTYRLAAGSWIGLWLLLALRLVRPRPYLRLGAALLALFAAAFAGSAWVKFHPAPLAVASAPRVPVFHGTRESETVHIELYEGDRVVVDMRDDGWAQVRTSDDKRGWTREQYLTFVGPPYEPAAQLPVAPKGDE